VVARQNLQNWDPANRRSRRTACPRKVPTSPTTPCAGRCTSALRRSSRAWSSAFVGGAFRWCLQEADERAHRRRRLGARPARPAGWSHGRRRGRGDAGGPDRSMGPLAAGSGIQHVEAVYLTRGPATAHLLRVLPAKFVGGVLSIRIRTCAGPRRDRRCTWAPTIGAEAARRARLPDSEVRMMQTALGGAGLAVAFNAPIGGALFHARRGDEVVPGENGVATCFRPQQAVACSRLVLGNHADFHVEHHGRARPRVAASIPRVFGLLTGCLGAVYNGLVLWFLGPRLPRYAGSRPWPRRPSSAPSSGSRCSYTRLAVGGGEDLTQRILSGQHIVAIGRRRASSRCGSSPGRCRTRPRCRAACSRRCLPLVRTVGSGVCRGCFNA
jgi:CIC family chloride channel protein